MKILIISGTPWDNSNSFGNTFSNLFAGMKNVEIYNISCQNGLSNNNITFKEVQMSDKSVLKSILNPLYDPCWEVEKSNKEIDVNQALSVAAIKKRWTIFFIIRDLIWGIGRWKRSKVLKKLIFEHKPDIIYLPIYASPRMCNIQQYIIKKLGVPVVGHISDDVYNIPPNLSFLGKRYRIHLQKKLKKLINSCEYLEVFAQNMADEYSKKFDIPCFLIGKGVTQEKIASIPPLKKSTNKPLKIIYTGNISQDRYSILHLLGTTIDAHFKGKAVIDIYTQSILPEIMLCELESIDSIELKGAVSGEEVLKIQQSADFLLHAEGFSDKSIFETKMSFSTKIIDYMLSGVPILAVGPSEVNSIAVLQNFDLAAVISNPEDTKNILNDLLNGNVDFNKKRENIIDYLKTYRDLDTIQNGIYNRLSDTLNKQ
ncbi:MAG: glycosyltransferase family 4 protein [Ruminococcaceae bacterium]|nr:glycosyltransferase family 4 protein [Oscillospiraceae bacterium]